MILSKKIKTYIYSCLFLIFIIFLYKINFLNWLKNTTHFLAKKTILSADNSAQNLCATYATSTYEDINLSKIKLLENENKELKNLLNFKNRTNLKTTEAMIIGKNFDSFERTVVIDKGKKDEVQIGHAIIAAEGVVIGKITKVEENLSIVKLLSDSSSRLGGMILNNNKSAGVIEGGYGLSIKMSFIPRNENIMIGEEVVTSGLDPLIPQGLLIGKIAMIENEAYKPFRQATISPSVNYDKSRFVFVIMQEKI